MVKSAVKPMLTGKVEDWHSEYAYSAGLQAFVYGFPYIYNAQVRHKWVTQPRNPDFVPYAALNEFWHAAKLMDATYRDGGCPNNDTLYSTAWLDLSEEPIILSHPDMGDRYFTFELMGVTSDNFDYIGQRATGSKAASFAIVGPGWTGELPDDVDQSRAHSPSPTVLIMGRTLVAGDADVATVKELQKHYTLTPLSQWGKDEVVRAERRDVLEPIEPEDDPLGPFKTLNAMLEENPPPAHHEILLKQFAHVGIGPGLTSMTRPRRSSRASSAPRSSGWRCSRSSSSAATGRRSSTDGAIRRPRSGATATTSCSARRTSQWPGSCATTLPRASTWSTSRTPTVRSSRPTAAIGSTSTRTTCRRSIVLVAGDVRHRPQPGRQPDRPLLDRRPGRPARGCRRRADDQLQSERPGGEDDANWLPSPADGEFFVILRMYLPRPEVIDATWECPPIERVVS